MQEKKLRDALEGQLVRWYSLPAGVDEEADELDTSPDDMDAHIAGLAVREIKQALASTTDETEMEKLVALLETAWEEEDGDSAVQCGIMKALRIITTQFGEEEGDA